jgi:hypothetical protein
MWSEAPQRIDHLLSALPDGHLALDIHYHGGKHLAMQHNNAPSAW